MLTILYKFTSIIFVHFLFAYELSIAYIWRRKRKHSSELLNLKLINSHEQEYHRNR